MGDTTLAVEMQVMGPTGYGAHDCPSSQWLSHWVPHRKLLVFLKDNLLSSDKVDA